MRQPPDSLCKVSRESYFHQRLKENLAAVAGRRRDKVDVLRAALWYQVVKEGLGASTAYTIERQIEQNRAFGKNQDGVRFHRNKWSKYEIGTHVPEKKLVAKAEIKVPGSARILNHPLWEALRIRQPKKLTPNARFQQLGSRTCKVVYKTLPFGSGGGASRRALHRTLPMLERRAGIDALAALTILLKEANARSDTGAAMEIGRSLYNVLLMLCGATTSFGSIAEELIELYSERIFRRIVHDGHYFNVRGFEFSEATKFLRLVLKDFLPAGKIDPIWGNKVRAMFALLDGKYGWDLLFALSPPVSHASNSNPDNSLFCKRCTMNRGLRHWGRENYLVGGSRKFPEPEILRRIQAGAWAAP